MRLAISSIAWPIQKETEVASILQREGVDAVEIAPTKIWPQPLQASHKDILNYRQFWENRGIQIIAMQALLFNRPDLVLFGSSEHRAQALEYLKGIVELGSQLGAGALVFGSPKNRTRGTLSIDQAMDIAIPFFRELGDYAAMRKTCVVLEANAPQYGCDFIVNSDEASNLVHSVGSEGFSLHLDVACMEMAGENLIEQVLKYKNIIRHFHVSAPFLEPVVYREEFLELRQALQGYDHHISIEMKAAENPSQSVLQIETALTACQRLV
jgi:D-psicose/D-tagatose/L-ribulose 3-epimerase